MRGQPPLFKKTPHGVILILVVVFTGIFILILSGVLGLIIYQKRLTEIKVAKMQALHIAEAGINYYRWHLAHAPEDFQDGTGSSGPYTHDYYDPTTGLIGTYQLEIDPPEKGSTVVTIRSSGWINKYPNVVKKVEVKYGKPSLAKYSFLTNTDIWLGTNESVTGEFHSNGGVRMDGTNDSLVTSAKETYTCTSTHGCSGDEEKPGVWGAGPNSNLWKFPVPEVDFNTITIDLAELKKIASTTGNYYPTQNYGYHVIFQADGTYNIYTVTSLMPAIKRIEDDNLGYWEYVAEQIQNETFIGNFPFPQEGVIFIEDNVWVEGIIKGKVTLASARFPESFSTYTDIYINNNLTYTARDSTNVLGLVAQKNILVPKHAPSTLTIDAVLLAQKGRVMRLLYSSYKLQDYIEVYGGIITNKIWTWTWVNSQDVPVDGYQQTKSIYNANLMYEPPPHFPTQNDYHFISWEELP